MDRLICWLITETGKQRQTHRYTNDKHVSRQILVQTTKRQINARGQWKRAEREGRGGEGGTHPLFPMCDPCPTWGSSWRQIPLVGCCTRYVSSDRVLDPCINMGRLIRLILSVSLSPVLPHMLLNKWHSEHSFTMNKLSTGQHSAGVHDP